MIEEASQLKTHNVTAERIIIGANGAIMNGVQMCRGPVSNADLETALRIGDVRHVPNEAMLIHDIQASMRCEAQQFDAAIHALFDNPDRPGAKLTDISWRPTHDAATLKPIAGRSISVLTANSTELSNGAIYSDSFATAGMNDTARYMVIGSNPFRTQGRGFETNPQMLTFMQNSVNWLSGRNDLAGRGGKIVIAEMGENFYFPDRSNTRRWIAETYGNSVSVNAENSCDGAALEACLSGPVDLLIISQADKGSDPLEITHSVEAAMQRGISVLYLHYDGHQSEMSKLLLPLLGTQYNYDNYWRKLSLKNYNGAYQFGQMSGENKSVSALLDRFHHDQFSIDFTDCENHNCPAGNGWTEQFKTPVNHVKTMASDLDRAGINLFSEPGRRSHKGLVLLADLYRQDIRFPMDKDATPMAQFLKSYYADSVVHAFRPVNPAQVDLGNFSRNDFSHIRPASQTVTLTARHDYSAAGVYALPGQTVRVTRHDSAPVNTHIRVNLIRSGATHEFDADGYNRPKYLSSENMPIKSGETIAFTSPYGGPIQVKFDEKDVDVQFTFENIGQHAIWRDANDNQIFTDKLAAQDYDWAELITPSFQVHSKADKMQDTTASALFPGAANIGAATQKHLHNYPHALAGFQGPGIDIIDEVHDFANDNGLTIHTLDKVKHMNADQATCGYGCSGNPYDAYWSFNPLGHGDIHEMGHGLERSRFRYTDQVGHTVTNPYSYYSKWKYFEETGDARVDDNCQSLPYQTLFETVQASRNAADPAAYMRAQDLTNWNYGAAINLQIGMAAQDAGILIDGYHVLARQHIIDREFNSADNNDNDWLDKRAGLGFDGMSRDEARALSNNDWNLIALSHALGRNMTDYLSLWGFELSPGAKAHVHAMNLPMMPTDFYIASPKQHCRGLGGIAKLPVDGTQVWPVAHTSLKATPQRDSHAKTNLAAGHICEFD